jgi:hypothetical protein
MREGACHPVARTATCAADSVKVRHVSRRKALQCNHLWIVLLSDWDSIGASGALPLRI